MRIVELRLRNQFLSVQLLRAIESAAGKLDVRPFGLDDILLQLGFGAGESRPRGLKVRFSAAKCRLQLLLIELREDVAGLDVAVHVDRQRLDDPVGFGLDLDFGRRLDLSRRDDRLDHRPGFRGDDLARIDLGRSALEAYKAGDRADDDDGEDDADVKTLPGRFCGCHTSGSYVILEREVHSSDDRD